MTWLPGSRNQACSIGHVSFSFVIAKLGDRRMVETIVSHPAVGRVPHHPQSQDLRRPRRLASGHAHQRAKLLAERVHCAPVRPDRRASIRLFLIPWLPDPSGLMLLARGDLLPRPSFPGSKRRSSCLDAAHHLSHLRRCLAVILYGGGSCCFHSPT